MDLDKALVSAIISEGKQALNQVRDLGVSANHLDGQGKTLFELIVDHSATYGDLPSVPTIQAKTGIALDIVQEPAAFFAQEVLNRALFLDLKKGADDFSGLMEQAKPQEALDSLETLLRAMRKTHRQGGSGKVEELPKLFKDVEAYYERIKSGERGIETPWPTVNAETLGLWPEDLALIVARVGIGKTWSAAKVGHHAWTGGCHVLFGTTEISKLRIAMRFAALHFNISYRDLRMGTLDAFNEKKFKDGVAEVMDSEGLKVIGGDFDFKVESYEAAVEATAEDAGEEDKVLAILDGAYLLKVDGHNRIERAANAFDELKRVCKRTSVPNLVTMQFNREVKANVSSSVSAERIALTDVAAWNADLIYGLIQTEDMKADKRMIFKPLKVREGVGEEFEVNWDLDVMNFTELPKVGGNENNDDDPFGTGIGDEGGSNTELPF